MTALGVVIIFMLVSTILTAVYYNTGNPKRIDVLTNMIDYTLAVTEPDGYIGSTSSNGKFLFRMNMTKDINKMVGKDSVKVGELHVPFYFSFMGVPD